MEIIRTKEADRVRIVGHNKPVFWIIIGLLAVIIGIAIYLNYANSHQLIGGDKDEHGCLIAAGYSWNETKQECVREWEESAKTYCTNESRNAEVCTEIYAPVCGSVQVQCFTTPCNPQLQTFANSCVACANSLTEYYTEGECPTGSA